MNGLLAQINLRTYLLIAAGSGLATYGFAALAGPLIVGLLDGLRPGLYAVGIGPAAVSVFFDPIILILQSGVTGAVLAGALWPAMLLWLFVFVPLAALSLVGAGAAGAGLN
jgi:hypothetical protein